MKLLWVLLLLAALIGGWFAGEYFAYQRVVPTGRVATLDDYLSWRPSAQTFAAVDVNGRPHVIAYGRGGGLLPSGPSAYVFNEAGQLIDWSRDIGDDPAFDERWNAQAARGRNPIPRHELEDRAAD